MHTPFYTGSGDDGVVRIGKKEHSKASPLFDTLGFLDATNAQVGWARIAASGLVAEACLAIQEMLFVAQAEVASLGLGGPVTHRIRPGHTRHLEQVIAYVDERTPKLSSFVVPGGCELAARLDIARTAARTLERNTIKASRDGADHVSEDLLRFLNRLSSVLFALARLANHEAGIAERAPGYGMPRAES